MKIIITEGEINQKGWWDKYCDLTGRDYYGRGGLDHEVILTEDELRAIKGEKVHFNYTT